MQNKYTNNKGQALLFVVVTMTVALSIGIGLSLRTLSSISRVSTSDTASRVLAAAEGGAENFLTLSVGDLKKVVGGDCLSYTLDPDGNGCVITFDPVSDDKITAKAFVKVEEYGAIGSGEFLTSAVKQGSTVEVNLEGYSGSSIDVCWKTLTGNGSDMFLMSYNSDGDTVQQAVKSSKSIDSSWYTRQGFADVTSGSNSDGFTECYELNTPSDPYGLRIQPLNEDVIAGIYPMGASLPNQGFKIISTGVLNDVTSTVISTREAVVFKSLPHLPHMFNFGVYSELGVID